jgi:IS30 family transposase
MAHTQLSRTERERIESMLQNDESQAEIAAYLERSRTCINNEIRKNSYSDGRYNAAHADKVSRQRRANGRRSTKHLLQDGNLRKSLLNGLNRKDSPEQIMAVRKQNGKTYVCHETVYQFLYTERRDLVSKLRQKKGRYRRRKGTNKRRYIAEKAKKRWITERPEKINSREELGHWEGDIVKGAKVNGKDTGYILTLTERKAGYNRMTKLEDLKAKTVSKAIIKLMRTIPKHLRKSITFDNGIEWSDFEITERELNMTHYFAIPYSSNDRASNENFNGLVRDFFPKKSSFANVTQKDVEEASRNLNQRPRKRLNYLNPTQALFQSYRLKC